MINGPSLIPNKAKNALILFHGYGADGMDLFTLCDELSAVFDDMAFFAPNGLGITIGGGYEWFSLDDYFSRPTLDIAYLSELEMRAQKILPKLNEYIQMVMEKTGLQKEQIFIAGFSQGGLVASQLVFLSKEAYKGLILMSPVPIIKIPSTAHKIPVLITRGMQDTVIPLQAAEFTKPTFINSGFSVEEEIDINEGHGISSHHLIKLIEFIQQQK